tara:strand:- start:983 stop:1207 length:225 start_codon:yes stop_codon:yes gene_type:complete
MSGETGYAIWQAAHKGDRAGLTRLVELGMDVNARDEVSAACSAISPRNPTSCQAHGRLPAACHAHGHGHGHGCR